ncbi:MAG: bifunctional phosphopantothenoylcysteine decarboxylase/phosphopantothenate--cysteine ligase CoaBC [Clostridia bacterium]|nr:bifunctional phosphopantothenoylcysteine decarboxylase/phosphopantothenate--cysteine ligase CoaBC [Clostridia bacterium]
MLKGKTVVIGVCGGIAAYKVVEVVSRLRRENAEVHVIMTENAAKFVTPLTFQSLSHNLVITDMFDEPKKWDVEHISLARKADMFVVAPATANIIGKVANGIADDMLTTTIMATRAPVLFVPAMNSAMYENPIVQSNISKLASYGYLFMEPGTGVMAAEGEYGKGRLPEPEAIVAWIEKILNPERDLEGKRILITAGPTREAIDPVRFISNHSSGKMGYAMAEAAVKRGAEVILVSGPVNIKKPDNLKFIDVISAEEMYDAVMKNYEQCQAMIMVAAVADYKCAQISDKKIKKKSDQMTIELKRNHDITKELGKIKGNRILVGTCAETNDLIENAKSKLKSKNLDMIMANDVTLEGAGFGVDTNIVKILLKSGEIKELPLMSKLEVAEEVLDEIVHMFNS